MTQSPKYSWRPFKQADLETMNLLEEKDIVLAKNARLQELSDSEKESEFCGIAFWGEQPLYIGGYYPSEKYPFAMRVFIIPDKYVFEAPIAFYKSVKRWLKQVEQLKGAKLIYSLCMPLTRVDTWMESLGFVYAKTIPSYINGEDYAMWGKVVK